jgi:hypothetical protein
VETFGPTVPDVMILKNLESLDRWIIEGIREVNNRIQLLSGAASQGVPLISKMKAMDALRAWIYGRTKDDKSIYSCYRNV